MSSVQSQVPTVESTEPAAAAAKTKSPLLLDDWKLEDDLREAQRLVRLIQLQTDEPALAAGFEEDAEPQALPPGTIADTSGPFSGGFISVGNAPAINASGLVAFRGQLDAGGEGLFIGPNTTLDKVIKSGDPLFGSTADFVALSRDHLYDVDRLISAAATYTILSVLLIAGILVAVPRLARLASAQVDPALAQTALSLMA